MSVVRPKAGLRSVVVRGCAIMPAIPAPSQSSGLFGQQSIVSPPKLKLSSRQRAQPTKSSAHRPSSKSTDGRGNIKSAHVTRSRSRGIHQAKNGTGPTRPGLSVCNRHGARRHGTLSFAVGPWCANSNPASDLDHRRTPLGLIQNRHVATWRTVSIGVALRAVKSTGTARCLSFTFSGSAYCRALFHRDDRRNHHGRASDVGPPTRL